MPIKQEILELKARIARVFAQREDLKQALERGDLKPRGGFIQLERVDRELSDLDSRFKALWDVAHSNASPPDGSPSDSAIARHEETTP